MKLLNLHISHSLATKLEVAIIILMAVVPLFFTLPYRDNIYLSWEGAFRMSQGQMPFRDFGLPMGYAYWLVPALFFKLFGPYLHTLVKAQVLINIISGVAFRSILKNVGVDPGVRLLSVFVYVLSFSFLNFWPWYNHTVIVYELVGLAFLLSAIGASRPLWQYVNIGLSALFLFLSFFTKQDGGAFAVMAGFVLIGYWSLKNSNFKLPAAFVAFLVAFSGLFILPLLPHEFGYWFNYGQPPHNSRISLFDIANEVFGASLYLKLYVLLIGFILISKFRKVTSLLGNENEMLFLLVTLLVLFQAFVLQVTSYVPRDGNIYFHSFAFAYIVSHLSLKIKLGQVKYAFLSVLLILFWWSGPYWKYANRLFKAVVPQSEVSTVDQVGINSFTINRDTTAIDASKWVLAPQKEFNKIKMPESAVKGMEKLQRLDIFKNDPKPKVLNMSEYTPLASVLDYELESGTPLWYHLNVAMFENELKLFESRIRSNYYDLVLFEVIPDLNNFYPFRIHDVLQDEYELIDRFQAPRDKTYEVVEVYVPRRSDH